MIDDELDRLRERSRQVEEMEAAAKTRRPKHANGGLLGRMTPGQRLVLAILLLLNMVVLGWLLLVATGALAV